MKKREIKPLSFIFSQTLKIPFPHLETRKKLNKNQTKPNNTPHLETHLYKSHTARPSQNWMGVITGMKPN